jgi:hypothetical protein
VCASGAFPVEPVFSRSRRGEDGDNQRLMRLVDETAWLKTQGHGVNRKRVSRLTNKMGIEAIYPKKRLSRVDPEAKKHPYLPNSSFFIAGLVL